MAGARVMEGMKGKGSPPLCQANICHCVGCGCDQDKTTDAVATKDEQDSAYNSMDIEDDYITVVSSSSTNESATIAGQEGVEDHKQDVRDIGRTRSESGGRPTYATGTHYNYAGDRPAQNDKAESPDSIDSMGVEPGSVRSSMTLSTCDSTHKLPNAGSRDEMLRGVGAGFDIRPSSPAPGWNPEDWYRRHMDLGDGEEWRG